MIGGFLRRSRKAFWHRYVCWETASRHDPPGVPFDELLRERSAVSSRTAEVAVVIEQMRWDPRAITAAQVLSLREFRGVVEEEWNFTQWRPPS
jgi:hypothetical protein